jgi:hypothetical protein
MYKSFDPEIVFSGQYLEWSFMELRAYVAFAAFTNFESRKSFPSQETLAQKTECSSRTIRRAIKKFKSLGILTTESTGKSLTYTFHIVSNESDRTPTCPTRVDINNVLPDRTPTCPTNNSSPNNSNITTTEWLDPQLRDLLIRQYGESAVNDRVVVISKMNGEIKRSKPGLLIKSLRGGYIPTCKEYRDKEAEEKRRKFQDEQMEKARLDREQWDNNYDPQTANKALAEIMAKLEKAEEEGRITV